MKSNNQGFTLIELLVVIAIIGILSSVVLASLNSARVKARVASAQSTMKSLQGGMVMCLGDSPALAINIPTETQNGGGGVVCTGSSANYSQLPAGWTYCDGNAALGCTTASTQTTGTSFSISARGDGATLPVEKPTARNCSV